MKTTLDMAREAGLVCNFRPCSPWVEDYDLTPHLKAFEALVRADEREQCAKVCDEVAKESQSQWPQRFATMIRARGNT